jgi:hypothetical protein
MTALTAAMNGHVQDPPRQAKRLAEERSSQAAGRPRAGTDCTDLLDRVQKLRSLLPAFAQDTAVARRETTTRRSENAKLRRRIAELEGALDQARAEPGSTAGDEVLRFAAVPNSGRQLH